MKNVVIFGIRNNKSIAYQIAKDLFDKGYNLHLAVETELQDQVATLLENNQIIYQTLIGLDVRSDSEISAFFDKIADSGASIDYILHSIAYANSKVMCTNIASLNTENDYLNIPLDDWIDALDISAYSLVRIIRAAKTYLKKGSSILTLTFNASQRVYPNYAGMAMVKAALENMVKYIAVDLGKMGVRINALSPGIIMTTSSAAIMGSRSLKKITANNAPLGNITAEDISNAAFYYLSDLSERVTGNIHYVDGGFNILGVNES